MNKGKTTFSPAFLLLPLLLSPLCSTSLSLSLSSPSHSLSLSLSLLLLFLPDRLTPNAPFTLFPFIQFLSLHLLFILSSPSHDQSELPCFTHTVPNSPSLSPSNSQASSRSSPTTPNSSTHAGTHYRTPSRSHQQVKLSLFLFQFFSLFLLGPAIQTSSTLPHLRLLASSSSAETTQTASYIPRSHTTTQQPSPLHRRRGPKRQPSCTQSPPNAESSTLSLSAPALTARSPNLLCFTTQPVPINRSADRNSSPASSRRRARALSTEAQPPALSRTSNAANAAALTSHGHERETTHAASWSPSRARTLSPSLVQISPSHSIFSKETYK